MDPCPFCKQPVADFILQLGGKCPHCFIEIPGEEAPTDPGEHCRARVAEEEEAVRPRRSPLPVALAGLTLLTLGASAWWFGRDQPDGEVSVASAAALEPQSPDGEAPPQGEDPPVGDVPETPEPPVATVTGQPGGTSASPRAEEEPGNQWLAAAGDLAEPDDFAAPTGLTGRDEAAPVKATPKLRPAKDVTGPDGIRRTRSRGVETIVVTEPAAGTVPVSNSSMAASPLDAFKVSAGPQDRLPEGVRLSDPAQIALMARRVMERGARQLQQCYEAQLKVRGELAGGWKVSFVLTDTTTASEVKVVGLDVADPEMEACMVRAVRGWSFQPIDAPLQIDKTFRFGR